MSRTAAIDVLFSINFAVVFDFMYFRFRPIKAKWIGIVLPNRWNATTRSMFFFSCILRIAYWRTESFCVIRQGGVNRKKAREILTGNYRRYNIVAHCLMARGTSLRQYISAGSKIPSLVLTQRFISPSIGNAESMVICCVNNGRNMLFTISNVYNGNTLACEWGGGGVPIPTRGQTDTVVL